MATISHYHVASCLHGIHQHQLDHQVLLARAGINPAVIEQTTDRVHTDQVARLFRLVQQALNDEFMGFTSQPCKYGVFATLCELLRHGKTLRELLEKTAHFYSLITDTLQIQLLIEGGTAELRFNLQQPALDQGHFLTEFLMVIWHRFPSWYIGETIRLRETHFIHATPAHQDELRVMFPSNLLFQQPSNSLFFDTQYLEKPLVRTDRELEIFLANHPADIMTIPGEDNSLEAQIERTILNLSNDQLMFPKTEDLAEELNISALTLYRRLLQEGTSYQKIKDNIRREVAINKLVKERLSVDQVSEIVGFAESRSFTRAFKHWTGLSPRNYCKYHKVR
ncbi:MAG: AraC family transcriptional regulator [Porticoccus sp.]